MKIILSASALLVLLVLALPLFVVDVAAGDAFLYAPPSETPLVTAVTETASAEPPEANAAVNRYADETVTVRLLSGGEVLEINMHDYLTGVVAAEMPASFHNEALKAQAVAARTYTLYKMQKGNHANSDVCDDFSCCKAYLSPEKLHEKWGANYEFNIYIVKNAVSDTDGEYVSYLGEPIFAAFHSSSSGYTESCENVWSTQLPYLVSVETPENSASVPNYNTELQVSYNDFRETVLGKYPNAKLDGGHEDWFGYIERSGAGRIVSAELGGLVLSGTELRLLFGLRSAAIEWELEEEGIRFLVTGYGHGVGMSQYGANEFAKNGASYQDILMYYYRDTEVLSYKAVKNDEADRTAINF